MCTCTHTVLYYSFRVTILKRYVFKTLVSELERWFEMRTVQLCCSVCNGGYTDDFTLPQLQSILAAVCQERLCLFHKLLGLAYKSPLNISKPFWPPVTLSPPGLWEDKFQGPHCGLPRALVSTSWTGAMETERGRKPASTNNTTG